MGENKIVLIHLIKIIMQTIVKVIIALLFSHISVSEPVKEDQKEKADLHNTLIIKKNSCVSMETLSENQLI